MASPIPAWQPQSQRDVIELRRADASVFHRLVLRDEKLPQRRKRERCVGVELEVATITYLRVSGLEGLGSPIISGVGSG